PGLETITHVIWPETAVPYVLRPDTTLPRLLGSAIGKNRILLTGTLRAQGEGESMELYNSLVALDGEGRIVGSYDKHKLVPFGEFLPFRAWLPKVLTTPVGEKDFSSGTGPAAVELPGLPEVSPLICYEGIF